MEHRPRRLVRQGLYDPSFEHDACGVGFVANINGVRSHDIIQKGLKVLENLTHRGACGCDPLTGDGAGLIIQVPDAFLRKACAAIDIELPAAGEYGVGLVFMPRDVRERNYCEQQLAKIVREEGQRLLGWRSVPVDVSQCGKTAREIAPEIRQVFIGRGAKTPDTAALERKLFVIRKRIERLIRESSLNDREYFYIPSLSSRTLVYKGLLLPEQIPAFYLDLVDPEMVSALALVHQRFSTNTLPSWERAHPYRFLAHNGEINTVRGNENWMRARERLFASPVFGDDLEKLMPIIEESASDSGKFDNAFELLVRSGRSLPHAAMMMKIGRAHV